MSWGEKSGICDRCGKESESLEPAFGKHICGECKTNRPRKGEGNAGLYSTGQLRFTHSAGLHLDRVPKSDGLFGKLFFEHYPQSKGIVGRALCYLIYNDSVCIGIIGASSPPYNYRKFREYFCIDDENLFLNNNVFRLIENKRNLGTQVLKLFRKRVLVDYLSKYSTNLIGLVTFVEPPRTGAVYKADNWDYLGETEGKRMRRDKDTWAKVYEAGTSKLIFGYKYKCVARR